MGQSTSGILSEATNRYLSKVDPQNPPSVKVLVSDILDECALDLRNENSFLARNEKHKINHELEIYQIAAIMNHLYTIKRIAGAGLSNDSEYDILAIYQEEGPDKGIYVSQDDAIRKIARNYYPKLTPTEYTNLKCMLGDLAERVECCRDPNLIAVNNGIFDYDTKLLRPFTPDLVFTSKSKVNYNPLAVNVVIHNDLDGTDWDVESWMHSLSDDDDVVDLLWETLGAIIRPNVAWNKSAWFYSETGNNGKGTLCELMRQLCGEGTYTSISLSEMGKDFALEPLINSSAIIVDENDVGTFIDKAANLKSIVTNDVLQINRKFKQPIAYKFRGFMVQCLNEMPRIKDKTDSFYRRQLFVPFTKCFTGIERKYIKNDYLHRQDVLEYVLYRVLNMNYYNLSEPKACVDALEEYREYNDPVRQFAEELFKNSQWTLLPNKFVHALYMSWFSKMVPTGSPVGSTTLTKELKVIAHEYGWCLVKDIKRGSRMDNPEPMIIEYNLRDWMNLRYLNSPDRNKLCIPPVGVNHYGGFVPIGSLEQKQIEKIVVI